MEHHVQAAPGQAHLLTALRAEGAVLRRSTRASGRSGRNCELRIPKRRGVPTTTSGRCTRSRSATASGRRWESSPRPRSRATSGGSPRGMDISYTAKATSDITCIAETDPSSGRARTLTSVRVRESPGETAPWSSRAPSGSGSPRRSSPAPARPGSARGPRKIGFVSAAILSISVVWTGLPTSPFGRPTSARTNDVVPGRDLRLEADRPHGVVRRTRAPRRSEDPAPAAGHPVAGAPRGPCRRGSGAWVFAALGDRVAERRREPGRRPRTRRSRRARR